MDMSKGSRIKDLRESRGISQTDLADRVGVSKQTLYKYENDIITNIPSDKIEAMADVLGVSPADIMGWDNKGVKIPVLGKVAAGIPIEAIEDVTDVEEISEETARGGRYFALKIKGDSMAPDICNGDTVIVRCQEDAENGDIVIVQVNGDEATCKRLRKYRGGIELVSNNPSYAPMEYSNKDIEEKPVTIIGKVMELRRTM